MTCRASYRAFRRASDAAIAALALSSAVLTASRIPCPVEVASTGRVVMAAFLQWGSVIANDMPTMRRFDAAAL